MKSRIIYVLLALVLPLMASADNYVTLNGIKYQLSDYGFAAVVKPDNPASISGAVVIPGSVTYNGTTYPVKGLGYMAFAKCTNLTSITIPNSVVDITYCCFWQCTNLTEIVIPNSVTTLGAQCFNECSKLERVTLSNKLKGLPTQCFDSCTSLKAVSIPEGITTIGNRCFANSGLLSAIIPSTVTTIEKSAFSYLDNSLVMMCKNPTPPSLGADVFDGTTCVMLWVPVQSVSAYRSADMWKGFSAIVGYDASNDAPGGGSADVNADGHVDISDVNAVINTMLGK